MHLRMRSYGITLWLFLMCKMYNAYQWFKIMTAGDAPENEVLWGKHFVASPFLVEEGLQLRHIGLIKLPAQLTAPRFVRQQPQQVRLGALCRCLLQPQAHQTQIPATQFIDGHPQLSRRLIQHGECILEEVGCKIRLMHSQSHAVLQHSRGHSIDRQSTLRKL
jgi:hypothetical protein